MSDCAPYILHAPPPETMRPLVLSSPHSGSDYPPDFLAASRLGTHEIRRSEDMYVADLARGAVRHGAHLLAARAPRAYVDLNRAADEIDPKLFTHTPQPMSAPTPRALAGLGVIPRLVGADTPIYDTPLPYAEAARRIAAAYRPFHAALRRLLDDMRARFPLVILLDMHSMPSQAVTTDIVLGDRFGASCAPWLTARVARAFAAKGYRTARNTPYAGGYITEHYGAPQDGIHALQIEINRGLYMDEANYAKRAGYQKLHRTLDDVSAALAPLPLVDAAE